MSVRSASLILSFICLFLAACSQDSSQPASVEPPTSEPEAEANAAVPGNQDRDVYFGNFHVHTGYSFDGFTNGSITTPDDAYRWAKGESIPGDAAGAVHKILQPLDWYVVSDHAEMMGVFPKMSDPESPFSQLPIAKRVTSDDPAIAFAAFSEVLNDMSAGKLDPKLTDAESARNIWKEVVATTESHNEPGVFTTFAGYEWTSNPGQQNLHRVVIFRDIDTVAELPFSALDSDKPEDLWAWMDQQRAHGSVLLAIAHNGNASNGLMFPESVTYGGTEIDAEYSATRMRNEPVYEVTQIKGTSETWPGFSTTDEFADFELWNYTLSTDAKEPDTQVGSYARQAYLAGLQLEAAGKGNPYKFGLIGDSDTHNAAASIEENNYTGKFAMEANPEHRLEGPPGFPEANKMQIRRFSSGGLAAIWAESNTRKSLYAAIERKETFATSGPRMKVRFFAAYGFDSDTLNAADWVQQAYSGGVPMGGDLANRKDETPSFIVAATKEPDGANLDRIQIVKGWLEDGKAQEKVFDVALSDGRTIDQNGKVPPVGNTVNAAAATYTNDIGDVQLQVVWQDPEFNPSAPAFYYARVLEIPTPRWSTYDAAKLGIAPRNDIPTAIQERAWTSPIWLTP